VVEEHEGADRPPLRRGQQASHAHAAAEVGFAWLKGLEQGVLMHGQILVA
jgi:hypothetical protein